MDCSRDHVHEPFDTDVHEGPFGVISICTSSANVNEDVDYGDFLTLTGQAYREAQFNVDPLICNYKNQLPLRLIRSYNLQDNIAPNTGYRYDGLYVVIDCWIGASSDGSKYNKFALMRLADQVSPSWGSTAAAGTSSAQRGVPLSTRSAFCPNVYALRKCSLSSGGKRKFSRRDDRESLPPVETLKTVPLSDTSRKSVPESSIVMRHVFKKPVNNAENAISASLPDRKTLTCLGASTAKTHSTNISIRMGLYESSHNAQDAKKSVSTMLHKPTKPVDIANRTLLDVESARVPPREDGKPQAKPSPSDDASCDGHVATDNANETACPLIKRRKYLSSTSEHSLESLQPAASSLLNGDTDKAIDCKDTVQDAQRSDGEAVRKLNSINGSVESAPSPLRKPVQKSLRPADEASSETRETLSKRRDATEMSGELLCAQNIKLLESLTPDKILNLINKEKHHPLSKMLIGNVIGLTLEECAMMNASKTAALDAESKSRASPKVSLRKRDNAKENVACLDNRRCCRYSRSKRLSWKVTKQPDTGKLDRVLPGVDRQSCNDAVEERNGNARVSNDSISKENEYLSPFRVQTSLQTITRHTRSSADAKTRPRTADKSALAKREFPSSSTKKSRYKKRDREIANLSIDANFGPMPRGPRNRRLRCRNSTCANKKCCHTVMYSPSKRYNKSTFKRNKSKLTKVSRQRARDRQAKDRYKVSGTLHANRKDVPGSMKKPKNFKATSSSAGSSENCSSNSNNENGKKNKNGKKTENKSVTINVNDERDISKSSFDRNLRQKLTRTAVPLPQRAAQTSRLPQDCFRKKADVEKKPNTTDATTQCRLITENPEIYVIGHLDDHRTILKMEWPKFIIGSRKPESNVTTRNDGGGRRSRVGQTSRFCHASTFTEDDVCCRKDDGGSALQDRGSAFVPVHMLDSDLRIARLRSINFKPIIKPLIRNEPEITAEDALVSTSKVTRRDVAEEYDKYTNNEDNNVVVYMDDELQYQDIEEEDNERALTRERRTSLMPSVSTRSTLKAARSRDDSVLLPETLPSCENLESPWHGWQEIVAGNRSYWIGW